MFTWLKCCEIAMLIGDHGIEASNQKESISEIRVLTNENNSSFFRKPLFVGTGVLPSQIRVRGPLPRH